jgi:Tfp pilus assembly protein PilW
MRARLGRGPLTAVAALAALGALGAGVTLAPAAATASNTIPATRVGLQRIVTDGARFQSVAHTTSAAGLITATTITLIGDHGQSQVRVRFGSDAFTPCTVGNRVRGTPDTTPVTCAGLSQDTQASSTFTIVVLYDGKDSPYDHDNGTGNDP